MVFVMLKFVLYDDVDFGDVDGGVCVLMVCCVCGLVWCCGCVCDVWGVDDDGLCVGYIFIICVGVGVDVDGVDDEVWMGDGVFGVLCGDEMIVGYCDEFVV